MPKAIFWLLALVLVFGAPQAVSAFDDSTDCPGKSTPRADIYWCADFEDLSDCTPQTVTCWTDNGFYQAPGGGEWSADNDYTWKIIAGADAAVGSAYVRGSPKAGSSGISHAAISDPAVFGPRSDTRFNFRFYRRYSGGFLSFGSGHGPGVYAMDPGATCTPTPMKYQSSMYSHLIYYPNGCGFQLNIFPTVADPPVLQNNRWYSIEIQGVMDDSCTDTGSPTGCNGEVRLWIDGVLITERTNLNLGGVTHGFRWTTADIPVNYFHQTVPPWRHTMSFDNAVWSTNGTYIGPATNANAAGTADSSSPYLVNDDGMQAFFGHRPGQDCPSTQGYLGTQNGIQNRSGGILQSTVTHGSYGDLADCPVTVANLTQTGHPADDSSLGSVYRVTNSSDGTCTSGGGSTAVNCRKTAVDTWTAIAQTDGALEVTLTNNSDGGGIYWEQGALPAAWFTVPSMSIHGWMYLPSSNNYTVTNLVLAGFQMGGGHPSYYIGLSINGGNWSLRQRHNNGTPSHVQTSSTAVAFDTWIRYELIAWDDGTISVMVGGEWLWTNYTPPNSLTVYLFDSPLRDFARAVAGVIDFQGTAPFTVYYDDVNAGSVSFFDCTGWDAASCPFGEGLTFDVDVSVIGGGNVTSSPGGINCPDGGACSNTYFIGNTVTLTATPDPGETFAGWSGDCAGGGTCEVTDEASATATFTGGGWPETLTIRIQ